MENNYLSGDNRNLEPSNSNSDESSLKATMELIKKIIPVVCVADGGGFSIIEELFLDFLKYHKIKHTKREMLYKRNADLSDYSTIAFSTTGTYREKFEALMNFDKSNLRTVVVLNETAFDKI
jgi:hypothetical protein